MKKSWVGCTVLVGALIGVCNTPSLASQCQATTGHPYNSSTNPCYEIVGSVNVVTNPTLPAAGKMDYGDSKTKASNSVADVFEFTLASAGLINLSENELTLAGFAYKTMTLELLSSTMAVLDTVSGSNVKSLSLNNLLVNSGTYYVGVLYTGGSGLSYTGTVDAAYAPLPSTWTMLIAGFAGLGFFAYRGTKKNSAAIAA